MASHGLGVLAGAVLLLAGAAIAPAVAAADPTSRPPTCAERYPADGPAGLDLQLGCIIGELVGAYSSLGSDAPPRVSAWLTPMAVALAIGLGLLLVVRRLRRAAGRRLAPVAPTGYWSCPACRSLNPAGTSACYRCRRPWDPSAMPIPTDVEPPPPQSFGRPG